MLKKLPKLVRSTGQDSRYAELIGSIETIPYKLPVNVRWTLETVRPPFSVASMKSSRFSNELWECPRENIIVGMVYSRANGIGPGNGCTAWLCRNIAYDNFQKRLAHSQRRFRTVKGPKPFFKMLGSFELKKGEHPHEAYERAIYALWDAYEDLHGVNFQSKDWIEDYMGASDGNTG